MKKRTRFAFGLAVLAVLMFLSANAGFAQTLDGKWFRVVGNAKTKAVNPTTGKFVTHNFQTIFYVHFAYLAPNGTRGAVYDCELYCHLAPGASGWVQTSSGTVSSSSISEHFYSDWWMQLSNLAGDDFNTYSTHQIGAANPNIWKGGGEILGGHDAAGNTLYGWITYVGAVANSLPFTPVP